MINKINKMSNGVNTSQTIEISTKAVLKIIGVLALLAFLYFIRDILLLVFVSLILAAVLNPFADRFEKRRIPRAVSVFAAYAGLFIFICIIFALLIPALINEISAFAVDFPFYIEKIFHSSEAMEKFLIEYNIIAAIEELLSELRNSLTTIFSGIFVTTLGVLNNFISFIVVLVVTGYLVIQKKQTGNFLKTILPAKHQKVAIKISDRIHEQIGKWFAGQMALCFVIGLLVYIGLSVLGVPYALLLAIIAGSLELIPYLGPILSTIPAVFIALLHSPLLGMFTLILYFVVQQFENYIIVPQIMKKAVGINPLAVIIGMMIGAKLAGILGLVLAIPTIIIAMIFAEEFLYKVQK